MSDILHILQRIERTQEDILNFLALILKLEVIEMAKIDDVTAAVAEETTVIDSTVELLTNLTAMIKDAGVDPAKLDAVVASITANKQKLAAAVVANTPNAGGSTGGIA